MVLSPTNKLQYTFGILGRTFTPLTLAKNETRIFWLSRLSTCIILYHGFINIAAYNLIPFCKPFPLTAYLHRSVWSANRSIYTLLRDTYTAKMVTNTMHEASKECRNNKKIYINYFQTLKWVRRWMFSAKYNSSIIISENWAFQHRPIKTRSRELSVAIFPNDREKEM